MISEKLSTDSRRMLQNGVPQFIGFCRCTPCRQRRGKVAAFDVQMKLDEDAPRAGSAEAKRMIRTQHHLLMGCTPCRQRRGKEKWEYDQRPVPMMHPVQAAPRQSNLIWIGDTSEGDAPRAGSAEAKHHHELPARKGTQMHPVQAAPRQRRPTTSCGTSPPRCTPCRQRRGKARRSQGAPCGRHDAPRAGSAEAK